MKRNNESDRKVYFFEILKFKFKLFQHEFKNFIIWLITFSNIKSNEKITFTSFPKASTKTSIKAQKEKKIKIYDQNTKDYINSNHNKFQF